MIAYTMVGTNQLDAAASFYDALFDAVGIGRVWSSEGAVGWGNSMNQPIFAVTRPRDGNPATVGNGVMIALAMPDTDSVDRIYAKAIELGGTCEGASGPRGEQFYCGYFRDLDGNKINAFAMQN
ncbi:MAG: VOC family protein [Pseudomonadota bacterium]